MVENQSTLGFNRGFVIRFLMVEECNLCEIYRRMCDMYREASLDQKMFTNGLNVGLPLQAWVKKTVHGVETWWLSSKEDIPGHNSY